MSGTPRTDVLRGAFESALKEILESAEGHDGLSDRFRPCDARKALDHACFAGGYHSAYGILEKVFGGVRFDDFAGLERENAKLKEQRADLCSALKEFMEMTEEPPIPECSCHISPPCSDCVKYSGLRYAFRLGRTAIAKAE